MTRKNYTDRLDSLENLKSVILNTRGNNDEELLKYIDYINNDIQYLEQRVEHYKDKYDNLLSGVSLAIIAIPIAIYIVINVIKFIVINISH